MECKTILNGDNDDANKKEELEHNNEKDILMTQLSRMIIDTDNKIMQVHFEYFAKRLMQLFQYYNPDWNGNKKSKSKQKSIQSPTKENGVKKQVYIFLNQEEQTWNGLIDFAYLNINPILKEYDQEKKIEYNICLFLPEIVNLKSSKIEIYMTQIQKVMQDFPFIKNAHILTFFLTGQCIEQFGQISEFKKILFYPIFINNELQQYHCLLNNNQKPASKIFSENSFGIDDPSSLEIKKTISAAGVQQSIRKYSYVLQTDVNLLNNSINQHQVIDSKKNQDQFESNQDIKELNIKRSSSQDAHKNKTKNHNSSSGKKKGNIKRQEIVEEFKDGMGTLDSIGCYRAFYGLSVFSDLYL